MKYIKTYEGAKPPFKHNYRDIFSEIENVPHKSFLISDLREECEKYKVDFEGLVKEMLLNKKIAFQPDFWFDNDLYLRLNNKNAIGNCIDINFSPHKILGGYMAYNFHKNDILVKLENEKDWALIPDKSGGYRSKKIRIYNYEEGPIMEELETKKMADKYNI